MMVMARTPGDGAQVRVQVLGNVSAFTLAIIFGMICLSQCRTHGRRRAAYLTFRRQIRPCIHNSVKHHVLQHPAID